MSVPTLQETIAVPAQTSQLDLLRRRVRSFCRENEIDPRLEFRLMVAVDEHAANVIEHSGIDPGVHLLVNLDIRDRGVLAEVEDSGPGFDPTGIERRRLQPARSKRGYGLYLIHSVADCVEYRRTDHGTNVLSLALNLQADPTAKKD